MCTHMLTTHLTMSLTQACKTILRQQLLFINSHHRCGDQRSRARTRRNSLLPVDSVHRAADGSNAIPTPREGMTFILLETRRIPGGEAIKPAEPDRPDRGRGQSEDGPRRHGCCLVLTVGGWGGCSWVTEKQLWDWFVGFTEPVMVVLFGVCAIVASSKRQKFLKCVYVCVCECLI